MKVLRVLPLLLLLAACAGEPYAGVGPLQITPQVAAGYARYLKELHPLAFAVSEDGAYYDYIHCPYSLCAGGEARQARQRCEMQSRGLPCRVYALGRLVVWDGPVTVRSIPDKVFRAKT
ncbi:MAG: hypothetical protein A2516_06055 [Alphaproteobacteria bacterium RIFOXYD12_FULL_60_8]|nr:MAG: hypothetical protein A2516_06055 [Alphaproteobacteria bacterium RIFOXYD12_FULL_60_8]